MTDILHAAGCGCLSLRLDEDVHAHLSRSSRSTCTQWKDMNRSCAQILMRRTGSKIFWLQTIFLLLNIFLPPVSCDFQSSDTWTYAKVTLTYNPPIPGNVTTEIHEEYGRFGEGPISSSKGFLLHSKASGCVPYTRKDVPRDERNKLMSWIALMKRGNCTEKQKIEFAQKLNASAVVIYNDQPGTEIATITNRHDRGHIPVIVIKSEDGRHLAELVDNGTNVTMEISIGSRVIQRIQVKKSWCYLFRVSFIVLMTISLAWLVFYYIQRFRYAQARGRTQKRLGRAAKKAITKLPSRTLRDGDEELSDEFCPICLETYTSSDCIRILPCKHYYHKNCVDQWLIEHRTCPMCKLNILKALGYQHLSICPGPAEEGPLYVFDIGQIIFNATAADHDSSEHDSRPREVQVESIRMLRNPRHQPPTSAERGGVRVVAVSEDGRSESSGSDGSRSGSSSSEGILPPVTTTVEMHERCNSPQVTHVGPTTV
ncbi:RING finger protein 150-like isoform X2 [Amphiura filiformis]|uniref:RING finger protein 150-like isoform X2 n=1 Tax=Amphiura filiformis TaxID=82378 RepID=UPI003B20E149